MPDLIDICWTLFESVEDSNCDQLAKACAYLVSYEGFDIDSLPQKVYDKVDQILQEEARDTWARDKVMELGI